MNSVNKKYEEVIDILVFYAIIHISFMK